jgi:hypothetical protein
LRKGYESGIKEVSFFITDKKGQKTDYGYETLFPLPLVAKGYVVVSPVLVLHAPYVSSRKNNAPSEKETLSPPRKRINCSGTNAPLASGLEK